MRKQEFSIEIPDKEADAIHSGKVYHFSPCQISLLTRTAVDKAVEYILGQPDGMCFEYIRWMSLTIKLAH